MANKRIFSFTALGIWGCAFGYFICYWPYSALTKALSKGLFAGMKEGIPSFELLPISAIGAVLGMLFFLTVEGWWQYAGRRKVFGIEILCPNRWTFMSGLCSGLIIATTTLAYTFSGVSIVFIMLLMRGGVLILAPIVDFMSKRIPKWYSLVGLGLSFASLLVAFSNKGGYSITGACALNVGLYLFGYFVRLRFMSKIAKSDVENANTKYFVEEQLVASPFMLIMLIIISFIDYGKGMHEVQMGFTHLIFSPYVFHGLILGLLSSGTGFFGGLILLDKRENTYCVPVNRCSSVLAGVLASYSLMYFFHDRTPETSEMIGAGLIVLAIVFLTIPALLSKKK